ncbi:MAG: serine/threonine-protein kinase [Pseudonocardiaceae bacterium]
MGVVWQAMDERLQRLVAVKQLLLQPALSARATDEARARALREARIAARLQHPNAIIVYDVAEHDGEPCLVMEYLPSRSLAAVLGERGPLPVTEVASIGRQIASALAAAHAAQIVHRDVKPGNILITEDGTAKITDFGVSRAAGDVTVTQTGMMAGTPAYLAPEVARGQVPTPASDVFSLGATLYAAVEGHAPFGDSDNQLALLHAVAGGQVVPPRRGGPLSTVLMRLLATNPAARPDMHQAGLQLAAVRIAQPEAPTVTSTPPPTIRPAAPATAPAWPVGGAPDSSRRPRPRAGILAGAIVAMLAFSGGAVLLSTNPSGQQAAQPIGRPVTSAPAPAQEPPAQLSPPQVQPVDHASPIAWRDAGQLVIDYYNGLDDQSAAWQLLSPTAQAAFGDESAFRSHWSRYSSVDARNASGVTDNPDGSVNVPVDVNYHTGEDVQAVKRQLRVSRLDGQLLIDSDPR